MVAATREVVGGENKLHWVLTVQIREDASRARTGPALNLLRRDKPKRRGIRGKLLNTGWDQAYRLRLLGGEI